MIKYAVVTFQYEKNKLKGLPLSDLHEDIKWVEKIRIETLKACPDLNPQNVQVIQYVE